ncbi:MAG: metallophosphoesterase family protein [bacterium]|nr:metallophosphoesterase family protein [bacterium]
MKYGIISDIHSNLEALKVVLEELKGVKGVKGVRGVDKILCLGDIVGYGPLPNECIAEIKKLKEANIVVGNHDLASIGWKDISWFNEYAQRAIIWTMDALSDESRKYLFSLPEIIEEKDFVMVHGSLNDYTDEYITGLKKAGKNFKLLEERNLLLVGHTHSPRLFLKKRHQPIYSLKLTDKDIIKISDEDKFIVNVGAVGQPRDKDPRASFGIFDTDVQEIKIYRVPYDIKKTQELIRKENFSKLLIERLAYGY